jgi:hypothetical protein
MGGVTDEEMARAMMDDIPHDPYHSGFAEKLAGDLEEAAAVTPS